ncbi:hypothetical protein ACFWU3_18710 [Streptomyces sp. NPDC058685]|uniref:hypothetical protein n=1 Tax=Streptomyces sp. NPDC058685 TaxID=3346598 RepID=UPI003656D436
MRGSSGPEPPYGDSGGPSPEDDERPRWRPVLMTAVLVPAVGAAGGAAGPLFQSSAPAFQWLPLLMVACVFVVPFILLALGFIWAVNRFSDALYRARERRFARVASDRSHQRLRQPAASGPTRERGTAERTRG